MMGGSWMLEDLQKIVDKSKITTNQAHHFGNNGKVTVYATSEEEVIQIVTYASKNNKKITIIGGGTKRGYGGTKELYDIELSLSRMKGIIAHSQGDLTMTVKPGTTIKEINDYLATYKQMLPIDPALPAQTTIGGLIVANESGPKRLKYGSARDFVIGLRVVYPNGQVIRTGGKVVKNVAGYDMNKLFIGSMGTLGVVTEVTVKLRPIAKYEGLLLLHFPNENIENIHPFIVKLLDSSLEPASLELLNPSLSDQLCQQQSYTLAIALEDVEKSVHYQEKIIQSLMNSETKITNMHEQNAKQWWNVFSNNITMQSNDTDQVKITLKITSQSLDVLAIIQFCDVLSEKLSVDLFAHGGVGNGISRVYLKGNVDSLLEFMNRLRNFVKEKEGFVIVQQAPLTLRKSSFVWGERPPYFPILEKIKQTIDPKKTVNDKRFIGGI